MEGTSEWGTCFEWTGAGIGDAFGANDCGYIAPFAPTLYPFRSIPYRSAESPAESPDVNDGMSRAESPAITFPSLPRRG